MTRGLQHLGLFRRRGGHVLIIARVAENSGSGTKSSRFHLLRVDEVVLFVTVVTFAAFDGLLFRTCKKPK
jgi:hypothetical protein